MLFHPETPVGICAPPNVNAPYADRSARECCEHITEKCRTFSGLSPERNANNAKSLEFDICANRSSVQNVKHAEAPDAIEVAHVYTGSSLIARRDLTELERDRVRDGSYRISSGEVVQNRGFSSDSWVRYNWPDEQSSDCSAVCEPYLDGSDGCWLTNGTIAAKALPADQDKTAQKAVDAYLDYDDAALMAQAKRLRDARGTASPTLEAMQIGAEVLRRSIIAAVRFRESPA